MSKAYQGPFEYDPWSQMITYPKTPHMVGQFGWPFCEHGSDNVLIVRGWGGLHTTFGETQGAMIQDAMGRRIAELLNTHGIGDEVRELIKEKAR